MVVEMKRSEVCERAAEVIEKHGWTQGLMGSEKAGYCLLGAGAAALIRGSNLYDWNQEYHNFVHCAIVAALPTGEFSVTHYNDTQLTSKEEAVDTLMTAAKHWRDRGE